ncbi:uncharacterized protein BJX67DRAFT_355848 [Aspergillus lucknowensis]|uniref:Secreted protein n=1 Tax=Aspergillus lucknowensis TaxID=176173 RepID=A0ABR4LPJ6_9EURO
MGKWRAMWVGAARRAQAAPTQKRSGLLGLRPAAVPGRLLSDTHHFFLVIIEHYSSRTTRNRDCFPTLTRDGFHGRVLWLTHTSMVLVQGVQIPTTSC